MSQVCKHCGHPIEFDLDFPTLYWHPEGNEAPGCHSAEPAPEGVFVVLEEKPYLRRCVFVNPMPAGCFRAVAENPYG